MTIDILMFIVNLQDCPSTPDQRLLDAGQDPYDRMANEFRMLLGHLAVSIKGGICSIPIAGWLFKWEHH